MHQAIRSNMNLSTHACKPDKSPLAINCRPMPLQMPEICHLQIRVWTSSYQFTSQTSYRLVNYGLRYRAYCIQMVFLFIMDHYNITLIRSMSAIQRKTYD